MNTDKPILIDALHINMGGALMILNHFVERLIVKNINFVLLKDSRCPELWSEAKVQSIVIMPCGERLREKYYLDHCDDFKTIFCLGNIPPAIKMQVPVYTYIHNVSLLMIPKDYPLLLKLKTYLKRFYIQKLASNTDSWIVQTINTKNLVVKHLPNDNKPILIYPFYHIPKNINRVPHNRRTDYVFIGECTKAKGHEYLIEAWVKLAKQGFNKRLHLTVSDPNMCKIIKTAQNAGANIVNHGYSSFEDVIDYYNKSKATIYPSLNESLGLGIIEALEADCDVIACDLPYVYSISSPTLTFKPSCSDSIVDAVMKYERKSTSRSRLLISDMADNLIDLLNG